MSLLILILICLLVWNVSLIWKGGRDSAITLAVVNAIPAGLLLLLELSFDGGAWYFCVSWIAMALLVIGLLSGWALRFWNVKRLLVWCACFALAIGGAYAGSAYEQHLRDITLLEHFDYTTYTPFQADSLVKTLDEEPALRFAEGDPLPKMDGATALYPVYAAFAQAVYPSSVGQMEPWEVWEIVNCSTTSTAYRKIVDGPAKSRKLTRLKKESSWSIRRSAGRPSYSSSIRTTRWKGSRWNRSAPSTAAKPPNGISWASGNWAASAPISAKRAAAPRRPWNGSSCGIRR